VPSPTRRSLLLLLVKKQMLLLSRIFFRPMIFSLLLVSFFSVSYDALTSFDGTSVFLSRI
jgi:hypothetical protein